MSNELPEKPDFRKIAYKYFDVVGRFDDGNETRAYVKGCERIWNDYYLPAQEKWIDVNERLPEIGQKVLCYYLPRYPIMEGRTYGILNRLVANAATKSFIDDNGFGNASQVTHWMPLPEPPKLSSPETSAP